MNLIPSYNCNFNCPFCVVHTKGDQRLLDLDWFEKELKKIGCVPNLNIIGGEPTQLPQDYLERLINICHNHLGTKPSMYTNLSAISPLFSKVILNVSFNPGITEQEEKVKNNLLMLDQPFRLNMILTSKLTELGVKELKKYLRLKNLTRLSISRYTHFVGREDFTPSKEAYQKFISDLLPLMQEDERIHFYPVSSMLSHEARDNSVKACAEVLPDNRYRISIRDFWHIAGVDVFREYSTWEDVEKAYQDIATTSVWSGPECAGCKYQQNCFNIYDDNTDCAVMNEIGEKIHEHLSEL